MFFSPNHHGHHLKNSFFNFSSIIGILAFYRFNNRDILSNHRKLHFNSIKKSICLFSTSTYFENLQKLIDSNLIHQFFNSKNTQKNQNVLPIVFENITRYDPQTFFSHQIDFSNRYCLKA
ncbi:hypothetical protein SSS_07693 [Sarcoptes scabiei]|nr:hypothetical protein SSS_07693 [Sarcoptes scabiei]